jgi:hypothetical protein
LSLASFVIGVFGDIIKELHHRRNLGISSTTTYDHLLDPFLFFYGTDAEFQVPGLYRSRKE